MSTSQRCEVDIFADLSYLITLMKLQNRLVFSTVFLMVLLCFTFVSVKPGAIARRDRVKKEDIISRTIGYIRDENVTIEDEELRTIAEIVYAESSKGKVDYRLVLAIMKIESNFRQDAVSEKGARGLLQVKPSLAKYVAEDAGINWRGAKTLDEPGENIKIGVHLFSKLVQDFESINMALHAYHVGPTKLRAILTGKSTPKKRFLNLVLDEYHRNSWLLPPP
jgi:soluble lytic murein transglycosylase